MLIKDRSNPGVLEITSRLQRIFVDYGINVQAFVHKGRIVYNPVDVSHCWIIEPDFIFSVRLHSLEKNIIQRGTDERGKISLLGGFYVWRVPATEEVLDLIKQIES